MQDSWSFTCCLSWTLDHRRNVASLSLFYRYYFGRCSSELAQLVSLPYSRGRSTRSSDRLHDLSVIIPRSYKDVYVNSFFPCTTRLWNYLSIECFPWTFDLSGLIFLWFDLSGLTLGFEHFCDFFLATPCLLVIVQPCMEWIPIKKNALQTLS